MKGLARKEEKGNVRWLVTVETDNDPIPACRLMNIFRRKALKILCLALTAQPDGFSILALVDSPEADVEHVYNFLRGTGGVRHVVYYREEPSAKPTFVFIDSDQHATAVARFMEDHPDSKLIFASHGKFLYEVGDESSSRRDSLNLSGLVTFAPVKKSLPRPELVASVSES
jgi:hypothetical protein